MSGAKMKRSSAATRLGRSIEVTGAFTEDLFEIEGWTQVANSLSGATLPLFQSYLNPAFQGLGIDSSSLFLANYADLSMCWAPVDVENLDDFYEVMPTQAYFFNDFIPSEGVIIADSNLNPANAMTRNGLNFDSDQITHIQRWSDAAFMSWKTACLYQGAAVSDVRYIFRAWITSQDTLNAAFQAVLGSPNGAGTAYFLLTHKDSVGVKSIYQVDIFTTSVPYTLNSLNASAMRASVKIVLLFYVAPVSYSEDS